MYSVVEALIDSGARGRRGVHCSHRGRNGLTSTATTPAGVVLDGGPRLDADVVLANADLPYVYQNLLPQDGMARRLARKRYSCSVISFFWGVDQPSTSPWPAHAVPSPTTTARTSTRSIGELTLPANPSLYCTRPGPARPGRGAAGSGHADGDRAGGAHRARTASRIGGAPRCRAAPATCSAAGPRTLDIPDLESHIKFEETYTPLSWHERYNLVKGATHGLSHTPDPDGRLQAFQPASALRKFVLRGGQYPSRHRNTHGDGLRPPGSRANHE